MTEKRLMQLSAIANGAWNRGLGESSAALKECVAEIHRLRAALLRPASPETER